MPKLALRFDERTFVLPDGDFVIGRAAEADLIVDDRMVSKRHLKLTISDDAVEAEDCGSRNGTFLNGKRLDTRESVRIGDLIVLGQQELRVVSADAPRRDTVATRGGMNVTRRVRPPREAEGTSEMRQDGERLDEVETAIREGDHARAAQSLYTVLRWLRDAAPRREDEDRKTLDRLLRAAVSYGEATDGWEALAVAIELHCDFLWAPAPESLAGLKERGAGVPTPAARSIRKLQSTLGENRQLLSESDGSRLDELESLFANPGA